MSSPPGPFHLFLGMYHNGQHWAHGQESRLAPGKASHGYSVRLYMPNSLLSRGLLFPRLHALALCTDTIPPSEGLFPSPTPIQVLKLLSSRPSTVPAKLAFAFASHNGHKLVRVTNRIQHDYKLYFQDYVK